MQTNKWMAGLAAGLLATGCVTADNGINKAAPAAPATPAAAVDYAKPGFFTQIDKKDGRLWVLREGSKDAEEFQAKGPSARQVLRPGVGPGGITLKSTESETITEYVTARPGFHTQVDKKDGRLWVLPLGSKDLEEFQAKGPSARQVLRPNAGPGGITLKSTESAHLDAYLAVK